jgi:hypothetical protein
MEEPMVYFAPETNTPLTPEAASAARYVLALAREAPDFPFSWYGDKGEEVEFLIDEGMDLDNGIMGMVSTRHPWRVWLSPTLGSLLNHAKLPSGAYDVAAVVPTIFHELTHLRDMRLGWRGLLFSLMVFLSSWKWGTIFLGMTMPLCRYALERRGEANARYAENYFATRTESHV